MTTAAAAPISPMAVFKRRDFVLMWFAQLISTAGSALTDLAAGIYVYDQTGSAFLVGLTLMATAVPSLVVGLIAGVFVDRWDRRKVMMASNLLQAVVVACIPFVLDVNITLLFVLILVNAGVKQFFDPAYEALIPEIASDEELTAANAFLQIASFGSTAIGFAGAGLLAAIDIRLAFWIDALTFLVSAGCIWFMKTRVKLEVPDEETSVGVVVTNLKLGIRTILDTPMLRSLFLLGAPVFFSFGLWNVLLLPMAIKVLGGTEFQYGIQEALTSVGFVLGSLFMAKYAGRLRTGLWIFVGTMGMGVAGVLYGLSPNIWIAIVFVMISGFFNSPSAVARQTLLQRNTPRELRGRVFSALFVMRDVIFLLGMAGAGLADIVDVRLMIVLASLILVVVALAALVAPGVGRPAAEWRRALTHLRSPAPAGVGEVRPATMGDFDRLVGRLATFTRLSDPQRAAFVRDALVREVPEGSRLVTHGDKATAASFILEGEAAAGIPEADGGYRGLSTMGAGDFFGEIAALTGSPRTADVVATRDSTLLEVPAESLRAVMQIPEVNKLLLATLTERLLRSNQPDLPRLASMDQAALRDLRTKAPTVEALPRAYDAGS
ncbi:MAG TPA: MFS transporter [Candidatus Limnocylindrales bacterium]|nr:MFS transporter [Candidatus Limnocylindrales bacterium]